MSEPVHQFFLIIPPGFEQVAAKELQYWLPEAEISEQSHGGIAFKANLESGLGLNRTLKVPSRILLRLADFGCRDFPKLFKKIKNFPWAEWLPKNSKVQVEASTHQSRLKIKKRIEATTLDALKKAGFQPSNDEDAFKVYVRLVEDVCYLSLDTSGEILHKRGYREYVPDAPIRENLAAAILLKTKEAFESQWPTGEGLSSQKPTLIDPMAGSGTFLIEALQLYRPAQREFAFENFVPLTLSIVRPAAIPLMPLEARENSGASPSNSQKVDTVKVSSEREWVGQVFGIETDTKAIVAARRAFENSSKQESVKFACDFVIEQADLLKELPEVTAHKVSSIKKAKGKVLVCNPPYGKRLKIEERFSVYYPKLLDRFEELFAPDIVSIILPQKVNLERLRIPGAWKIHSTQGFSNGGFAVVLITFTRKPM